MGLLDIYDKCPLSSRQSFGLGAGVFTHRRGDDAEWGGRMWQDGFLSIPPPSVHLHQVCAIALIAGGAGSSITAQVCVRAHVVFLALGWSLCGSLWSELCDS